MLLGIVYLFFAFNPVLAVFVALFIYFVEVLIDNTSSRLKWEVMLKSAWFVTALLGVGNLLVLYFVLKAG